MLVKVLINEGGPGDPPNWVRSWNYWIVKGHAAETAPVIPLRTEIV